MRVTGNRMIDVAAAQTAANQSKVAEASDQVSSGLKVAKPSDDPMAWMAAQRASLRKTMSDGASSALEVGRERLEMTDGALAGVGDALATMQEMAVQGSNATYSASDRKDMAAQVRSLMAAAIGSANKQTADGEYVLAGNASTTKPFGTAGVYGGDASSRALATTEMDTAGSTITGAALTAANGVDVIPLFERVAVALENNDATALQGLLGDVDTAVKQVGLARTRTGGTINILSSAIGSQKDLRQHLTNEISRSTEADVIESASNLAKASTALEASKAVTSFILQAVKPS